MDSKIDDIFNISNKWHDELEILRCIVLDCGLNEELKWGVPCYTHKNKNILIIHGFKEYCALLFFNGALLQDQYGILIQQTPNVQAGRQMRLKSVEEINKLNSIIKAYIFEAIEVEIAGLKVVLKKHPEYIVPAELEIKFEENPEFMSAFNALTPGRQRAYILYFLGSNQAKTRNQRVDKYFKRILNGKGLNDCICGLSKKYPVCDGSHKFLVKYNDEKF